MPRSLCGALVLALCLPGAAHADPPASRAAAPQRIRPDHFAQDVCRVVAEEASLNGLPASFLARLIWKESRFSPNAVSPKGARGIAQFMPGTAAERGLSDPHDPASALVASARLLSELRVRFGSLGLAAGAYNAGAGRVQHWLDGEGALPMETQRYVHWITGHPAGDWKEKAAELAILPISPSLPFDAACVDLAAHALTAERPEKPFQTDVAKARAAAAPRNRSRLPWLVNIAARNRASGKRIRGPVQLGANTQAAAKQICKNLARAGWACSIAQN